jgi:hypothetical protein
VKRAARTDHNQADIVEELRKAGVRVADIHRHGDGVPDILAYVPRTGLWLPIEVKSATGTLTGAERAWWLRMCCEPVIVRSAEDAMSVVGVEAT